MIAAVTVAKRILIREVLRRLKEDKLRLKQVAETALKGHRVGQSFPPQASLAVCQRSHNPHQARQAVASPATARSKTVQPLAAKAKANPEFKGKSPPSL